MTQLPPKKILESLRLGPDDQRWLLQEAAERFGGDISALISNLVASAHAAEAAHADPWAGLAARVHDRQWPPYRVPVPYLLEFAVYWAGRPGTAADVIASLRASLTRRPGDDRVQP